MPYVAFLRAVNVGGRNKLPMTQLTAALTHNGFTSVQTLLQSGNVVFSFPETDTRLIAQRIQQIIYEEFQLNTHVVVWTADEVLQLKSPIEEEEVYVTLFQEEVKILDEQKINLKAIAEEQWKIEGKSVFLFNPIGYRTTKLTNDFFEKQAQQAATTRHYRTIEKVKALL